MIVKYFIICFIINTLKLWTQPAQQLNTMLLIAINNLYVHFKYRFLYRTIKQFLVCGEPAVTAACAFFCNRY